MRLLLSAMLAFCVVGCVADEPSNGGEAAEVLTVSEAEGAATVTAAPGDGITQLPGDVDAAAFTFTFFATCNGESVTINGPGTAVVGASATSCLRRNGTLTGFVSWSGFCTGDIANCNGVLRCGGC